MSSNRITSHSTREAIHLKKQFDEIIMKKKPFLCISAEVGMQWEGEPQASVFTASIGGLSK